MQRLYRLRLRHLVPAARELLSLEGSADPKDLKALQAMQRRHQNLERELRPPAMVARAFSKGEPISSPQVSPPPERRPTVESWSILPLCFPLLRRKRPSV